MVGLLLLAPLLAAQDDAARRAAELVARLSSENLEEREEAQRALKRLGRAALPALEAAARAPDREAAGRASFLIRRLSIQEQLTPALRQALPGLEDRLAAGTHPWTLAFLEATGTRDGARTFPNLKREDLEPLAVPALQGAVSPEERGTVCGRIASAGLAAAGPAVLALLEDRELSVREAALLALGRLEFAEAIPRLLPVLKAPEPSLRRTAVYVLADWRRPEAVAVFRDLLKDVDPEVRTNAAWAAGHLKDPEAVPGLVRLLKDEDALVRQNAVWALGRLEAWKAAPDFERLLDDDAEDVRAAAARVLGQGRAKESVPGLVKRLKDADDSVRAAAAEALGRCRAPEAAPELRALLKDGSASVRQRAARTLGELNDPASVESLVALLSDPALEVRADAAEALGRLKAPQALPALLALLKEEPENQPSGWLSIGRTEAWVALGSGNLLGVGGSEEQHVQPEYTVRSFLRLLGDGGGHGELLPLLKDPNAAVRRVALEALAELEAKDAAAAVLPLLKDADRLVRLQAAETLGRWRRAEALPELLTALRAPADDCRHELIWVFLRLDAKEVIPELSKDLVQRGQKRREVACEALLSFDHRPARELFLEEGGCSFFNNAIRQPKEWARLLGARRRVRTAARTASAWSIWRGGPA